MQTSETIPILVNGEAKETPPGTTVAQLLQALGLYAGRVAIERNLQILPRSSVAARCSGRFAVVARAGDWFDCGHAILLG
jgi:sulfur carrier protein